MNKDPFLQKLAEESADNVEKPKAKAGNVTMVTSKKPAFPDPIIGKYNDEGILGAKPGTVKVSDKEVKTLEQSVKDGDVEKAVAEEREQKREQNIGNALIRIKNAIADEHLSTESKIPKNRLARILCYYVQPISVATGLPIAGFIGYSAEYRFGWDPVSIALVSLTLLSSIANTAFYAHTVFKHFRAKHKVKELDRMQAAVEAIAINLPKDEKEISKLMKIDLFRQGMKDLAHNGCKEAYEVLDNDN